MTDVVSGLRTEIEDLRRQIREIDRQASDARQEAHQAHEEVLRLRDVVAAAQRDQQDLRTARARLDRVRMRGLLARILNR
ncbi:hypothetical protein [Rhodovastum atsumiense]|uniref:Uncharacterized protein n=1 Tax=Rhodovastum atsumiense TaxID=504468 RepID=A0A5M6IWD7_9PROT|nr:hypothetical protein [Rhodovastum atsumiense]KAA5612289.1 hypothetical protein F1189_10325 [Rhodovastum atsumiense]